RRKGGTRRPWPAWSPRPPRGDPESHTDTVGPVSPERDEQALALRAELAGEYSLESEIGRGGMGIVYLARDGALDSPVAIKLLHESLASDPATRQRFLLEARTCARLVHPNIVPIFDVGERDSMAWI